MTLALAVVSLATLLEFHFSLKTSDDNKSRFDRWRRWLILCLAGSCFLLSMSNLLAGTINYFHTHKSYIKGNDLVESLPAVRVTFIMIGVAIMIGDVILVVRGG